MLSFRNSLGLPGFISVCSMMNRKGKSGWDGSWRSLVQHHKVAHLLKMYFFDSLEEVSCIDTLRIDLPNKNV